MSDNSSDHQKQTILLIEDDVFMIELLVQELGGAGFTVVVAKTGAEGEQKFQEAHPDLIFLDLMLPDKNGFDALREIRRDPAGVNVKTIVLSNLSEVADIEEAKRLGVVDYLVKANYSLPEIVQKARHALAG